MCNSIHPSSKLPKKSYGIGYKIIEIEYPNTFLPAFHSIHLPYNIDLCNWINWNNKLLPRKNSVGFCVFKSSWDAIIVKARFMRGFTSLRNIKIYKIQYADAFAEHNEMMYSVYAPILLVKSFRIIDPIS